MLRINCPFCGIRDEEEFDCGGEAHVTRPENPANLSDDEWSHYLFNKVNTKGILLERWRHTYGCRQWFNMARHTVSHEIIEIYPMGSFPSFNGMNVENVVKEVEA
ncbi:sarcosine oxidase subunit delta [Amphritea opalescens]|uniref:Sarcosine oxidase subunit delta n=1 Tax=Amphritea opalescens TaxID=2490544 RepID=A0A430KT54_9GAMM|nr:sarcosine oxidase subunit delta [Amphritea opalescens]RTE66692.1 sarcosine oxidase subunit delta [Amphritea opalescens]